MPTSHATHPPSSDVSVMISYSRSDAAFAQRLCEDLKQAGFPTWLDTSSILGGRLWRREIDRAIHEAQVVLVVMTPAAMKSKWVRREYTYAARQHKVIIPLDYYPCNIPALLAKRQMVSFRFGFVGNSETFYTQQFQALTTALSASHGTPAPAVAASTRSASERLLTGMLALVALVGALLAALADYANGALLPTAAQSNDLQVALGGVALFALSLVTLVLQRARRPDGSINLYLDDRERFLNKVHTRYTNRLKPPFAGALRLTLGLSEAAQAVARPALARQLGPGGTPHPLPAGTTITTAFTAAEGQLLILGAPGAGKSWLLYQLALALVEQARTDVEKASPVPVVFDLASWAQAQKPLTDWMVDQLTETWQVPPAIARVWVDRRQVFPLMDGLDEVREDVRDACVEAINRYQREHGLDGLAVCCRKVDYDALEARLDLRTAVVAEPLTPEQIDSYLEAGGTPLAALRTLSQDVRQMQDLLSTPLLLRVVALAYEGKEAGAVPPPSDDKKAWAQAVFHDYVPTMLARRLEPGRRNGRSLTTAYSETETTRYLAWLATQMQAHGQVDAFYLERLQPDWLSEQQMSLWQRDLKRASFPFLPMLTSRRAKARIDLVASIGLTASWRLAALTTPIYLLLFGALGAFIGQQFGASGIGLAIGLCYGLGNGMFAISSTLSPVSVSESDLNTPNQGVRQSLYTGLFGLIATGTAIGLPIAVALLLVLAALTDRFHVQFAGIPLPAVEFVVALLIALYCVYWFGIFMGMRYGLRAYLYHRLLLQTMTRQRLIPRQFVAFLDFAADHVLLQRVGGGYRFVHALLLDYFADQWPDLSATPPKGGG